MSLTILLTSSFPEHLNLNLDLRRNLAEGFRALPTDCRIVETTFAAVTEATRTLRPDLVLAVGSCAPAVCDYTSLAAACRSGDAKLAFWMVDDPYEFDYHYRVIEHADYIFTSDRWALQFYDHPRVYHLPTAASPVAHYRKLTPPDERAFAIFFCGMAFKNRRALIDDLRPILLEHRTLIVGPDWEKSAPFIRNERLSKQQVIDCYADSAIVLNVGRNYNMANAYYQLSPSTPGPRTFEAAMAGTVQAYFVESLEIEDYFVPGKEILLFENPATFKELIEVYLTDAELWREVAEAAQKRALREHTFEQRARRILACVGLVDARDDAALPAAATAMGERTQIGRQARGEARVARTPARAGSRQKLRATPSRP